MAQRVKIELVDDLDGESPADETVTFGLDGRTYEVDLTTANAAALREALAPYVGVARKVTGGRRTSSARAAAAGGPSTREMREWARANGFEVSDRGRVSAEIREAYAKAH